MSGDLSPGEDYARLGGGAPALRTQSVQRPCGRNELAVVRVRPGTSGSEPGFYSKWGVWEAVDSRTLPTGLCPGALEPVSVAPILKLYLPWLQPGPAHPLTEHNSPQGLPSRCLSPPPTPLALRHRAPALLPTQPRGPNSLPPLNSTDSRVRTFFFKPAALSNFPTPNLSWVRNYKCSANKISATHSQ